jgi:hypothetical protein
MVVRWFVRVQTTYQASIDIGVEFADEHGLILPGLLGKFHAQENDLEYSNDALVFLHHLMIVSADRSEGHTSCH